MDTTTLRSGQDAFLRAVEPGGFGPAKAPDAWPAELVVAHVIAANRSFTALTMELMMGAGRVYDNAATGRREVLEAIAAAAGGWDALLTALRQSAAELVTLAGLADAATAAHPVPSTIRDGDAVIADEVLTLEALLNGHATGHLGLHRGQLSALR
jgi:hypothetical protein